MISLFLTAALAAQSPLATRTIQPDGGPTLLVHHQESPLVAMRLSTPVPMEVPEGAVELLQELARPDAEATARRFGGHLELRHENGRAVIAVTGPAAAFDALAAILRRATGDPDVSLTSLRRARARAEGRVLSRLEQPGPRIRRVLRHTLHDAPPPRGAAGTVMDPESIRRLRARLYAPTHVRVVVVGAVPNAVIRSAFIGWPDGRAGGDLASAGTDTTAARARPPTHREWGGIAFPVDSDPVVLAVAAVLVQQRVDRSALRYGAVEAWHEPSPALVMIGAATPGDTVVRTTARVSDLPVRDSTAVASADMRRYLRRLIGEAVALAGADAVAGARAAVHRRLLLEARTATGKAEVIGRAAERATVSVPEYLERLGEVGLDDVRALLTRVLDTPAVVEGGH